MVLGDPDRFAVIFEIVDEWNIDSSFNNGILMFSVDGKVYPRNEIMNATLNFELPNLKRCMSDICVNEQIFGLSKYEAFINIYNLRFPKDRDVDGDYRYDISPVVFSDNNCLVFAVSNGDMMRVLAASDLEYIKAESRHDLKNIEVNETYITIVKWNEILLKLSDFLHKETK